MKTTPEQRAELARLIEENGALKAILGGILPSLLADAERCAELEEALRGLYDAANRVNRLGATTGPQWVKLSAAMLNALAAIRKQGGE